MACLFFEPVSVSERATHPGARLPLIREYDGMCHASGSAVTAPEQLRFQRCNHGCAGGECPHFPGSEKVSCMRYVVRSESAERLEILCVEEREHAPVRWYCVEFDVTCGVVRGDLSVPVRAQAEAFGRSYLACGAALR